MDNAITTQTVDRGEAHATGRSAQSPVHIPARGWKQVALRTLAQSGQDNIGLVAAGVTFYAFFALVPLLGATVMTYGLVATPATVLSNVKSLTNVMPAEAAKLVGEQLINVVQASGSKKGLGLLLALAIALFGARNAAGSVITALNIAYDEEETRGALKVHLLALAITAAAVMLAILATIAIAALGQLGKLVPALSGALLLIGKLGSYLLLLAGAAAGAATLYRYGPDRKNVAWVWITPGSIVASLGWILLTLGFGFYAANFANYGKTYGSLATVIVLLTWIYLSAYVLLMGAELNATLEHQTARDTTVTKPEPMNQREAWSADPVATEVEPDAPCGTAVGAHCANGPERPSASSKDHSYLTSRLVARAGKLSGGAKVGMLGSAMATMAYQCFAARAARESARPSLGEPQDLRCFAERRLSPGRRSYRRRNAKPPPSRHKGR